MAARNRIISEHESWDARGLGDNPAGYNTKYLGWDWGRKIGPGYLCGWGEWYT
jgi:hypothetical protein